VGDLDENVFAYTVVVDVDDGETWLQIEAAVTRRMLSFLAQSQVVAVSDIEISKYHSQNGHDFTTWQGQIWGERYGR